MAESWAAVRLTVPKEEDETNAPRELQESKQLGMIGNIRERVQLKETK
jgi:hypothetical protein